MMMMRSKLFVPCFALLFPLAAAAVEKPVPPLQECMQNLGPISEVPCAREGTTPFSGWTVREPRELAIRFGEGEKGRKSQWDFPVSCDLRAKGAMYLDIAISRPELSTIYIYLKSGDSGWYSGLLRLPDSAVGRWFRIRLSSESFPGVEGNAVGWNRIDGLRMSFLRPHGGEKFQSVVKLANFSESAGQHSGVPLVLGSAKAGPFAAQAAKALREMDLPVETMDISKLTAGALEHRPFVVLPYDPWPSDAAAAALKDYLAKGGRAIASACEMRKDVLAALGVKVTGMWLKKSEKGAFRLSGVWPAGSLANSLTGRVAQASWQTSWLEPVGAGETVATWADEKGADTGRAALVKTARGYVFGHVFLESGMPLFQAVVRDVWPEETAKRAAAREARRAAVAAFGKAADDWARSLDGKTGERRLMWCHSPLGLDWKGDWETSIRTLKECGYTDIIANFAKGPGADYPSKVAQVTKIGKKHGDLLAAAGAACRKHGVKLHAWLVCWPLAYGLDKKYIEKLDAEGRLQYAASGKRVRANNTDWLCPSSPENRELLVRLMLEFAERGADGVHFDYIRYPNDGTCFCAKCRERFEARLGHPCAAWPKDALPRGNCREAWQSFRRENVTALVRSVRTEMRRRFPGVEVSAAVFREPVKDRETVAQDWGLWLKEDLVDFVCPMDYTWSLLDFTDILRKQRDLSGWERIYPGIGLTSSARFPTDGGDALRFSEQVLAVRELGFSGFTCFDYDSRSVKAMRIARRGVLK